MRWVFPKRDPCAYRNDRVDESGVPRLFLDVSIVSGPRQREGYSEQKEYGQHYPQPRGGIIRAASVVSLHEERRMCSQCYDHALQCKEVWGGNRAIHDAISVPGIDVWIASDPWGREAGGDIYYVSVCSGGSVSRFVVADVCGHGVSAAEWAIRLRSLMRTYIDTPDLTRFARSLNREFAGLAQFGRFATAVLTTYFAPTEQLIVCNIGHPRPLWYHAQSQRWELLARERPQHGATVRNLPLGILEPTDYAQFAVQLTTGDLVLLYTDALMESSDAEGNPLGEQGLLDLVRGLGSVPAPGMLDAVLAAVTDYRGGARAGDDETLLVLHHNAGDPPKPSLEGPPRVTATMLGLASG